MMLLIRACIVRVCSLLPFVLLFWSSTTTPALTRSRLKLNGFTGCPFFLITLGNDRVHGGSGPLPRCARSTSGMMSMLTKTLRTLFSSNGRTELLCPARMDLD